jgi:NAD(P)-dependent dehydrogenase (short-subunit alcohol dehydrogenase family)
MGLPEDVAKVAAFLLDDELSGYLTGVNVPVDGGMALYTC